MRQRFTQRNRACARLLGAVAVATALSSTAMSSVARAQGDPCLAEKDPGDTFKTCFDTGNRLFLSAGAVGYGAGFQIRHRMLFDDEPDLTWKLEHNVLLSQVSYTDELRATIYSGRYLRHARDGHIVLPFGLPRKVFVPFDVGARVEVGDVSMDLLDRMSLDVGVVNAAALFDIARGDDFGTRLAIGVGSRWDVALTRDPLTVTEHVVAPLSMGVVDAHWESATGISSLTFRGEAGGEWSNNEGWRTAGRAEVSAERVLVAVNDRPLWLYGRAGAERGDGFNADVGFRFSAW